MTPADLAELFASMQAGVDLMVTITSDLLDLEKLRMGKFDVTLKDTLLHELIDDVANGARPACKGTLTATVHPSVPAMLRTDGGRLRQVLANGLSNACKHAANVSLTVTAAAGDGASRGTVTLRILDDGPGLRGVDVNRLFDDFAAAASVVGSRGAVRGSGLGLPICARLTRLLGGTLVVRDRLDGVHGVEFAVVLPCDVSQLETVEIMSDPDLERDGPRAHSHADSLPPAHGGSRVAPELDIADAAHQHQLPPEHPRTHPDESHCDARGGAGAEPGVARSTLQLHSARISRDASVTPTHRSGSQRRRIVVVDDAPLNRRIAERYVTSLGHSCVSLSDGDEVADSVRSAPADLILMDIRMVRMDGDAACRQLRAGGYTGPILAVSVVRRTYAWVLAVFELARARIHR